MLGCDWWFTLLGQDLSIAGKRAGLAGERSGLFMEQIRIIKEMRARDEAEGKDGGTDRANGRTDEHIRPRYMVWENVPGALSSGEPKGEDFRIVLEECARVKDPNAVIPRPPKGKWQNCGCIVGDGWSIAWTIRNAQFYGIPQRRRRIALVADFGGQSAAKILFESKSVSGNNRESDQERETREDTRGSAEGFGVAERGGKLSEVSAISFQERAGKPGGGKGLLIQEEHIGSMKTNDRQSVCYGFDPGATRDAGAQCFAEVSKTVNNGTCPGHHTGVVELRRGGQTTYRKGAHPMNKQQSQSWEETDFSDPLNTFDNGEKRTPMLIVSGGNDG